MTMSNPFPETLPVNMRSAVQTEQKKRAGLMRAQVGASFVIRGKDGKGRSFMVRELRLMAKRIEEIRKDKTCKDQPHLVCLHVSCRGRKWDTEEALISDHPEPKVMRDLDEAHVYAIWCEAPEFGTPEALDAWTKCEAQAAPMSMRGANREAPIVGLLVDAG